MSKVAKTYKASERGYIDGRIVEEGEVFTTASKPGNWMDEVAAEASEEPDGEIGYDKMKYAELVQLAVAKGIEAPNKLKKEELVAALEKADD